MKYVCSQLSSYLSGLGDDVHLEVGHALEPDLLIAVEDLEGLGDGGAVYDARGERDDVGRAGGGRV